MSTASIDDLFTRGRHTRTAVARLPLRQQVSFQSVANVPADSVGSRMPAGKLFQMRGPATGNDLAQSAVLVRGTSSIEVPADRMPGQRVPAWQQYSAKYAGAHPVRHLCTSVASL